MTADVKSVFRRHGARPSFTVSEIMQHRSSEETEPVTSTVDPADIRGLGTTLLVSVGCLPRSRHEGLSQSHNVHEGCTITGAASPSEDRCCSCFGSHQRAVVRAFTPPPG